MYSFMSSKIGPMELVLYKTVQSHQLGPGSSHLIGPPLKVCIFSSIHCQNLLTISDRAFDNFHQ